MNKKEKIKVRINMDAHSSGWYSNHRGEDFVVCVYDSETFQVTEGSSKGGYICIHDCTILKT